MTATSSTALQLPNIRCTGVVTVGALGQLLEGVYIGGDTAGTQVTIKRLHERPLGVRRLQALRRQAERTIGRQHPNLLHTHAILSSAGTVYLVLERLEGLDLARLRQRVTSVPDWV